MEKITYRKTLDVHKNGSQFLLQGFETEDILSRVIEISLMASGDAIDFPLERVMAVMYVISPSAEEPSIDSCIIKDNKIIYEVPKLTEAGITKMQLKLIETTPDGASSVIVSPSFMVEVSKSNADDNKAEQTPTFKALVDAVASAKAVHDSRFDRMELTDDCIFKAYYANGVEYETDILKRLFHDGNAVLSESFAHGGTDTRIGEDTDNSMYYSNVSKSEALLAKSIMENSKAILEEVRKHGMYTAFNVDFNSGELEYVSPSFIFNIDEETGHLIADKQTYTFEEEVFRIVEDWLATNNIVIKDLADISSTHTDEIATLSESSAQYAMDIEDLQTEVRPIEKGGTGASDVGGALASLGALGFEIHEYTGNGDSGSEKKCSCTFARKPKLIMLCELDGGYNIILPYDQKCACVEVHNSNSTWRNGLRRTHFTYNGNEVSWYGSSDDMSYETADASAQYNLDGKNYVIIGIG